MRTRPSFHIRVTWRVKNKYVPFMSGVSDFIDVYKFKDKIFVSMNKLKTKGLNFKKHPTFFVLRSNPNVNLKDLMSFMSCAGQIPEHHSVTSFQNTILDQNASMIRLETEPLDKDSGTDFLTAYEIQFFDLVEKKWTFLQNSFNLEEKKKIIRGYYEVHDKLYKTAKSDTVLSDPILDKKDKFKEM